MYPIVYIRTSTTEQNPDLQLRQCLTLHDGNYYLYKEHQSAWKDTNRDVFNKVLNQIKDRKTDKLIVWDLDRLYRNRLKLIAFFKFCKYYGCKVYSYRQQWLRAINDMPSPFDEIVHDLMLQIMGWIAEEESSKKSERVKLAVKKVKGITVSYKGNKWGRKGMSTQKKNKIMELHKEGMSIRQIALAMQIGVGSVHKTIVEFKLKKTFEPNTIPSVHELDNSSPNESNDNDNNE